jgi:hypothetical protein
MNPNLDPATDFEPTNLAYKQLAAAQGDPKWVERDVLNYDLGTQAPYLFSVLYRDGGVLVIPLTVMFFEPLDRKQGTVLMFRRHKSTGRVVPFQISMADPRLRDPALASMPSDQAFARALIPRFDPVLTPSLVAMLNEAQAIYMATGFLKVFQLQLMNPLLMGWSAAATPTATARTALARLTVRRAAQTMAADAAGVGERIFGEVAGANGNSFQRFLELARRLSNTPGLSPQAKADLLAKLAPRLGIDIGSNAAMQGGRILMIAKDGRTALQIALDGTISFGRFNLATLDIVNAVPIRPL